jgi:GNAT superfamily N-acetyltransferase
MNDSLATGPEWSIRKFQKGDEDQIRALLGVDRGVPRDKQLWQWLYHKGPAGPAIIWVAVIGQRIIGHSAVLPLYMKIGNQTCKGSLGIDIMVHPDYRRHGILASFRNSTYDYFTQNGISLTCGLVSDRILSIYRKLQTTEVDELPLLVKIVSWRDVLKTRYKIPYWAGSLLGYLWEHLIHRMPSLPETDIQIEPVSVFDKRMDDFWRKASVIKPIMVVKDMKYLNWKYVEKPGNEYKLFIAKRKNEIVGYMVLTREKDKLTQGNIADFLTLPQENEGARALIAEAVRYFQKEGIALISCWMFKDTPYFNIMNKLGFIRKYSGLRLGFRLRDPNLSKDFFVDPGNWYYVRADNDTM